MLAGETCLRPITTTHSRRGQKESNSQTQSNPTPGGNIIPTQITDEDLPTIYQNFQTVLILIFPTTAEQRSAKNVYDDDEIVEGAQTLRSAWGWGR
jgi:hypothetical protein